jgi:hypothetical protein
MVNTSKHKVSTMYSTLTRLNSLSSLLSSCVMALLGLIALSSLVFPVGHVDDSSVVIDSVKVYVAFSWIVDVGLTGVR